MQAPGQFFPPFIVAVAGVSGAGKTTLTCELAARLGNSPYLYFDEYPKVGPGIGPWLKGKMEPGEWETPLLAEHLERLRHGQSIERPNNRGIIGPTEYLIIEEPFGRSRPDIARFIDFVLYIDTPLEIALARRIKRDMTTCWRKLDRQHLEEEIRTYLERYESETALLYAKLRDLARNTCDSVLDGLQAAEVIAIQAECFVRRARSAQS